jgi:uncharacterized membrane protein HdeD (DUF308 family)
MATGLDTSAAPREVTWAWWLLLLAGLLGIAAGVIVLVEPAISLATLAVVMGVFLLFDGLLEIPAAIFGDVPGRGLLALLGVVSAIAGVLLVRHPIGGVVAVALLLGLWLITMAVVRLIRAIEVSEHRLWHIVLALVEGIAGIVIVSSPGIGVATLAVLVGISFIMRGIAMCALAWMLHGAKRALDAPPHGAAAAT